MGQGEIAGDSGGEMDTTVLEQQQQKKKRIKIKKSLSNPVHILFHR